MYSSGIYENSPAINTLKKELLYSNSKCRGNRFCILGTFSKNVSREFSHKVYNSFINIFEDPLPYMTSLVHCRESYRTSHDGLLYVFHFLNFRKAPTTICSLTLVGATLAPSTPVFAETQQPQTDPQGQPAVVAQEDLSTLNQVEGNATPQTISPQKRFY